MNSLAHELTHSQATEPEFELLWRRAFASPVFGIVYADFRRYGVKDLVVTSTWGLHLLQVLTQFL